MYVYMYGKNLMAVWESVMFCYKAASVTILYGSKAENNNFLLRVNIVKFVYISNKFQ